MFSLVRRVPAVFLAFLIAGVADPGMSCRAAEKSSTSHVDVLVRPKISKSASGYWPGALDREAYVYLRLTVTAAGKAEDVEVVDGYFEKRFADAAVKVAQESHFAPAMRNGVPEAFEGFEFAVVFALPYEQRKGVTPAFRSELVKVVDLVKAKKPDEAHARVEGMLASQVTLLYEVSVLHAVLAETNEGIGNLTEALFHSRRATAPLDFKYPPYRRGETPPKNSAQRYVLPMETLETAFRRRIYLDAKLGYAADGLRASWELSGLKALLADDPVRRLVPELERMLDEQKPLMAQAMILPSGVWSHVPVRKSFTVAAVTGGVLKDISVNCGRSFRRTLSYQPDVDWTLPARTGSCLLQFKGEPGTRFRILEANPPYTQEAAQDKGG